MKTVMNVERETKGTWVYKNSNTDAPIPSIYIKKSAFKDSEEVPSKITIEIKEIG